MLLLYLAVDLKIAVVGRALAIVGVGGGALRILGRIHIGPPSEGRAVASALATLLVHHFGRHFDLRLVCIPLLPLARILSRDQQIAGGDLPVPSQVV